MMNSSKNRCRWRGAFIAALAVLFIGCGKKTPSEKPGSSASATRDSVRAAARDSVSAAARDSAHAAQTGSSFRVFGSEPTWVLTISSGGMHFTSPDDSVEIRFPAVESAASGDTLRWKAKTEGSSMNVRVWRGECGDDVRNTTWPYSSVVRLNETTYIGCAEPLSARKTP
jgi:uncharacterized membrane protein